MSSSYSSGLLVRGMTPLLVPLERRQVSDGGATPWLVLPWLRSVTVKKISLSPIVDDCSNVAIEDASLVVSTVVAVRCQLKATPTLDELTKRRVIDIGKGLFNGATLAKGETPRSGGP